MSSIGKEFMEKTKFQYLDRSLQSRNLPQPPLEMEHDIKITANDGVLRFDEYRNGTFIKHKI